YSYSPGSAASGLDWLTTGSTLLAIANSNTAKPVVALGFSPSHNLIKDNTISNIRGGTSASTTTGAFAIDGNNLMINNIAYNNDTNYYYTPDYGDTNRGFANGQAAPGA
ncbi:MAG: hypothetical protein U1E13_06715, partial [Methylophilaceae bacterium]|nr:hypothetical protein [Methylophilaceae bacterium]